MSKFTTEIDTLELQQLQARAALTEGFTYSNKFFSIAAGFIEEKAQDFERLRLLHQANAFTEIAKMLRDIGNFK